MAIQTKNPARASSPQTVAALPNTSTSTRILLVEDEPLTAQVFAQALMRAGHIVEVARDGLQAVRRLHRQTPSLLVLDMSLPAMSGSAVVRELRSSGQLDLPIVVVSGSDQVQCTLTENELQPGVWLTKPVKPRQLVEIVDGFLGAR